jgi:predicted nucleotidyltransferase
MNVKAMRHPPLEILKTVFKRYPAIQAVYLFGSSASGRAHAESDLDLAVFADENNLCGRKLDILTELAKNGFCNVDLIFLPSDDIVLQHEAVRLNRIVYQRPDFDAASLFSLIVRRYLDFLPYLKVQREAYKQRVLHGQS